MYVSNMLKTLDQESPPAKSRLFVSRSTCALLSILLRRRYRGVLTSKPNSFEQMKAIRLTAQDVHRFWAKIEITPKCWNWTGSKSANGYGLFSLNGGNVRAHRCSHVMFIGPIPKGLVIDHLCGNKMCVRPAHLEAVTNGENIRRTGQDHLNAA